MTPDERLWIVEALERMIAASAVADRGTELVSALSAQLTNIQQRLDALSAVTAQIGVHAKVPPLYMTAKPPELANGQFMSRGYTSFDYDRVLDSVATWDTTQERIANDARYDAWFRAHGHLK